jgi:hypothetical protein
VVIEIPRTAPVLHFQGERETISIRHVNSFLSFTFALALALKFFGRNENGIANENEITCFAFKFTLLLTLFPENVNVSANENERKVNPPERNESHHASLPNEYCLSVEVRVQQRTGQIVYPVRKAQSTE